MNDVREFRPSEVSALLSLMRELATFEGYIDGFTVQEEDLLRDGIGEYQKFKAFVVPASEPGQLLGMAVIYIIPWTFDLKPILVLKELFVVEEARGAGVGRKLMNALIAHAIEIGASKIQWTVLQTNTPAKSFYKSFGATPDEVWESWLLDDQSYSSV